MEICRLSAKQTLPVRHQVLWPHKAPEFCIVEGDEQALHYGVMLKHQLVCVASLYLDGNSARLRKFATLAEHQSKGIGSHMLTFVIAELKRLDCSKLWFDARESALGFYQGFGFHCVGERFYKAEVAYFKMEAKLQDLS